jgi:hypothetical protein
MPVPVVVNVEVNGAAIGTPPAVIPVPTWIVNLPEYSSGLEGVIVITCVVVLYANAIVRFDVSGRMTLTFVVVTVAASIAVDIWTVGMTDMLTPVAPFAGLVDRTSGPLVVVNVQVEALPIGAPPEDWTDPETDAV